MSLEDKFRTTVQSAGAIFIGLQDGCVIFQSSAGSPPIRVYAFSCDLQSVRLALKAEREKLAVDVWEALI
jgi:hypothetical protein